MPKPKVGQVGRAIPTATMDGGRLKGDRVNDLILAVAWVILLGIIAVFDSEREVWKVWGGDDGAKVV